MAGKSRIRRVPEVVHLLERAGRGPVWGTESDDLNATLLAWPAGEANPEHVNAERDVLMVVVSGGGSLEVDGEAHELAAGDAVLVREGREQAARRRAGRDPLPVRPSAPRRAPDREGPFVIRGALAAALTPLTDGGAALDEDAFPPTPTSSSTAASPASSRSGRPARASRCRCRSGGGRRRCWRGAIAGRGVVIAHCGAQTTADTVELASRAGEDGAEAVAVIAPPYYRLDDRALLTHLTAAARAAEPLPFYVYEFAAASGYPVPLPVLAALREAAPNLAGLKVSDTPWESFAAYLVEGLDVFVGPEAFISQGMAAGAVGAVSALASAFPDRVAAAVREPEGEAAAGMADLRAFVESLPRHAALKHVVARRGVPMREDVRPPLRGLTDDERRRLDEWLDA